MEFSLFLKKKNPSRSREGNLLLAERKEGERERLPRSDEGRESIPSLFPERETRSIKGEREVYSSSLKKHTSRGGNSLERRVEPNQGSAGGPGESLTSREGKRLTGKNLYRVGGGGGGTLSPVEGKRTSFLQGGFAIHAPRSISLPRENRPSGKARKKRKEDENISIGRGRA